MTAAKRQRLAALTSMLAGHRMYGGGCTLSLTATNAEECAELRDAVTLVLGYQQTKLNSTDLGDVYRWDGKTDNVTLVWLYDQRKRREVADVVSLEQKRQERQLDEQLRGSLAQHGVDPDPNFRPGA